MRPHPTTHGLSAGVAATLPRNGHPIITKGNVSEVLADRAITGCHRRLHNAVVAFNPDDPDGPLITLSGYAHRYYSLQLAQQALIQALKESEILSHFSLGNK